MGAGSGALAGGGLITTSSIMRASDSSGFGFGAEAACFGSAVLNSPTGPVVFVSSAMIVSSTLARFYALLCGPLRISGFDGKIIPSFFVDFLESDGDGVSDVHRVRDFVDTVGRDLRHMH